MRTDDPVAPADARPPASGEAFTRRAITITTAPVVGFASEVPPALPESLLAQARKLDAGHRAVTGRPISRDALRAQMRIGRGHASALTAAVRAEATAAKAEPGSLQAVA